MSEYHKITIIHQIMIVDDGEIPDEIPSELARNIDAARSVYPDAEHRLWSGNQLRNLIAENFDARVLVAYDTLKPYSYKADLGRFALLYLFGGLYVDLGVHLTKPWQIPTEKGVAAFRDVSFSSPAWSALQTGVLWALPERPEFAAAIERIVYNCDKKYYGSNPLYPTGPVPLGRAFLAVMTQRWLAPDADDQFVGECRCATPDSDMLNVTYVSREGTVIGFRSKRLPGDLEHLGLNGSNNYNVMWSNRSIYGEETRLWSADDMSIKISNGAILSDKGIVLSSDHGHPQIFGPHAPLQAGHHVVSVKFTQGSEFDRVRVDLTARGQKAVLKTVIVQSSQLSSEGAFSFPVDLDENQENIEFIVHNLGKFAGAIVSFSIREIRTTTWDSQNTAIQVIGGVRTNAGIRIRRWRKGRVTYGPYVNLNAGSYQLKIYFSADTWFNKVIIDFAAGSDHVAFARVAKKFGDMQQPNMLVVPFSIAEDKEMVEFRLETSRFFFGTLLEYQLIAL